MPAWWGDLCEVLPEQISGNTIGFYETSQAWGVFHDLPIKLIIQKVPVGIRENNQSEFSFRLIQSYPNPFNPSTTTSWQSPVSSWQTLKVYDVLGNEVATLVDKYKPAGRYVVEFSARCGQAGRQLASGVYYYRLKAGEFVQSNKMVILE